MAENQNKRSKAVALQYEAGNRAPHVVAAGAGEIARKIIQVAQEHGVPIQRDDSLVDILTKLDIGQEIPSETYRAVAEILAFLYRADNDWRERKLARPVSNPAAIAPPREVRVIDSNVHVAEKKNF